MTDPRPISGQYRVPPKSRADEFTAMCEFVLRHRGVVSSPKFICGVLDRHDTPLVYKDAVIEIAHTSKAPNKGMEVIRVETQNPIVMRLDDGSILRTHGELDLCFEHVQKLVLEINQTKGP